MKVKEKIQPIYAFFWFEFGFFLYIWTFELMVANYISDELFYQ